MLWRCIFAKHLVVYIFKWDSDYWQLIIQPNTDSDSIDKARPFMIPAEGADGVDYFVYLPKGLSVHCTVEFIEVLADGFVVHAVELGIAFIDHLQNGFTVIQIRLLGENIVPQGFKIGFHDLSPPESVGDGTLGCGELQLSIVPKILYAIIKDTTLRCTVHVDGAFFVSLKKYLGKMFRFLHLVS